MIEVIGIIPSRVKLLDFPELRQTFMYDCGALSLQSVLVYYGLDINESSVMQRLGTTEKSGTSIENMITGAKSYGIEVVHKVGMSIEDLKSSINCGYPTIISLQAWVSEERLRKEPNFSYKDVYDEGHYVVCIGYDDQDLKVYFEDPADPRRTWLSWDTLSERWHDQDDNGKKYERWGMTCIASPVFRRNQVVFMR